MLMFAKVVFNVAPIIQSMYAITKIKKTHKFPLVTNLANKMVACQFPLGPDYVEARCPSLLAYLPRRVKTQPTFVTHLSRIVRGLSFEWPPSTANKMEDKRNIYQQLHFFITHSCSSRFSASTESCSFAPYC